MDDTDGTDCQGLWIDWDDLHLDAVGEFFHDDDDPADKRPHVWRDRDPCQVAARFLAQE